MKKLCAIGEALIDFIPEKKGQRLKDVASFKKVAGGAPANVAAAVAKLNGKASFITQLGEDAFGDYIISCLQQCHIDTSFIKQTSEYDTSLAFVSLADDGNRDFKFYRRTAADLQFSKNDIQDAMLTNVGYVHFCSVSLVESPMKEAHRTLLQKALDQQIPICFDPNLRLSLWDDEEVEFITGKNNIEDALPALFSGRCEFVIYTMGKDGACLYTKDGRKLFSSGYQVNVVDTTGAGDSFIGAFLYKLLDNYQPLAQYQDNELLSFLSFANAYAAYTTTKEGALAAMANQEELQAFMNSF